MDTHQQVWQLQLLESSDWAAFGASIGLRTAISVVLGAGPAANHPYRTAASIARQVSSSLGNDALSDVRQHTPRPEPIQQRDSLVSETSVASVLTRQEAEVLKGGTTQHKQRPGTLQRAQTLIAKLESVRAGGESTSDGQVCAHLCERFYTHAYTYPDEQMSRERLKEGVRIEHNKQGRGMLFEWARAHACSHAGSCAYGVDVVRGWHRHTCSEILPSK